MRLTFIGVQARPRQQCRGFVLSSTMHPRHRMISEAIERIIDLLSELWKWVKDRM